MNPDDVKDENIKSQNDLEWPWSEVDQDSGHSKNIKGACWTYRAWQFGYARAPFKVDPKQAHIRDNAPCSKSMKTTANLHELSFELLMQSTDSPGWSSVVPCGFL